MIRKNCRLERASRYYMGGGGSGGGQAPSKLYFRNPSKEWPAIENWYGKQEGQFYNYLQNDPIFNRLYSGAQSYFDSPTAPILGALQKQGLDYLQGGPSDISQALNNLGLNAATSGPSDLTTALGQFGMSQLNRPELADSPLLNTMQNQARTDLLNQGKLTPALNRDVRNDSLATAGAMGMGFSPGTLGTELLNREKYREQRDQQNRQYAATTEGLSQSQEGVRMADLAQRFGFANTADQTGFADLASRVATGQAGQGAQLADVASRFSIGEGVHQLSMQDIAQRFQIPLQVAQGGTQNFSALTNPILSYLNNAFTPTVYGGGTQSDNGMAGIGQIAGTVIGAIATAY